MEIAVVAGVALLLFGGKRLADIGGGLGQGIKAFKQGLREADAEEKRDGTQSKDSKGS